MSLSGWLNGPDGKRMRGMFFKGVEELKRFNDNSEKLMNLLRDPLVGGTICEVLARARGSVGSGPSIHDRIREVLDGG